ncbi:MAG: NADH-quinone oxidoreductase subunit NuoH [candidate division KSB1 bacterium]|nr:NADH-quinone oxidoreductase subunit NuoH [candidate division KSB1 bacterium]MDQ7063226.1 NADH-quinone oxidoreductase subunit NuoH [candidate division KSB1 bacterium]
MQELIQAVQNSQTFLSGLSEAALAIIFFVLFGLVFATVAAVCALVFVYLERKISAHMQDRLGPMEVNTGIPLLKNIGHGWAQTLADAFKLLLKEDIVPNAADRRLHLIAPFILFCAVIAAFSVMPFGEKLVVSDMNIGVFFVLAITSFSVIGVILAGWASNNKWSLLGGMRSAAQIVSYEIPSGLVVLVIVMQVGSLRFNDIVMAQAGGILHWHIFQFFPLNLIAFIISFLATLAEANRAPFDLPEAESELTAGFATEYSGFKWAIFYLSEYANMFLIGIFLSALFLGGWTSPFGSLFGGFFDKPGWQPVWIILKAVAIIFLQMWLRWTLPRLRVDQLMYTSWKVLTPFAFVTIFGVGLWMLF